MNNASKEFNRQLELDVLLNGLTEITEGYVNQFNIPELIDVIIPEGVTRIGCWAFLSCDNLKNVTVPRSVTSIGIDGFGAKTKYKHMKVLFTDRSLDGIRGMYGFPWGLSKQKISVQVS